MNGIIETNRPDNKNNQYHALIKQGDNLLTKLQKYGAAVKLSGQKELLKDNKLRGKSITTATENVYPLFNKVGCPPYYECACQLY